MQNQADLTFWLLQIEVTPHTTPLFAHQRSFARFIHLTDLVFMSALFKLVLFVQGRGPYREECG